MLYIREKVYKEPQIVGKVWKGFLHDKTSWYSSAISLVLLTIFYSLFFSKKDLLFFPNEEQTQTTFYDDSIDKGHSQIIQVENTQKAVGVQCILKEGFPFPYVGFEITQQDQRYFDLSKYNRLEVEVSAKKLDHLFVYLTVKDKNIRDNSNRLALRRLISDLQISNQNQTLSIPLSEFVTPDWWYNIVNQPKSDFSSPEITQVKSVIFSTGINPKLNTPCTFTIHQIRFYRDNTWVIISMGILQLALMALLLLVYTRKNRNPVPILVPIHVSYKATEVVERTKTKSGYSFLDYIHEYYSDPELSLVQISKSTGIGHRMISDTISEKFGCNIKTYINQIRIIESQRLLLESDLKVNEIAYQVGFNSAANYNRVFKALTGISPSEFLGKKQGI